MSSRHDVNIIDLNFEYRQDSITCRLCGRMCDPGHGVPVDSETAQVVGNDFQGEWGGIPCCPRCYDRHQAGEFVGEYPKF